jgi:hypothetical protein
VGAPFCLCLARETGQFSIESFGILEERGVSDSFVKAAGGPPARSHDVLAGDRKRDRIVRPVGCEDGDGQLRDHRGEVDRLALRRRPAREARHAQEQGLSTAIADGMMSTAWISSMLLATFGRHYLERGDLRTKYIKTTEVGISLKVLGRVRERDEQADGSVRFVLDVWIEDKAGVKLTDGDAVIDVRPQTTG